MTHEEQQEFRQYSWVDSLANYKKNHYTNLVLDFDTESHWLEENHQHEVMIAKPGVNLLDKIPDGILTINRAWRVTYWNSQAEKLLLKTKAEVINQNFWQEFPEFTSSNLYEECLSAIAHGNSVELETFYPVLETWFEVRLYPEDEELLIYFRDITSRKQTEAELLERSRLSTLEAVVGKILIQGGTLSTSLQHCAEATLVHLDSLFAGIWTFSPGANRLELQAFTGQASKGSWIAGTPIALHHHFPLEGSLIGFVAQTRQPYLTQNSSRRCKGGFESRFYQGYIAESCLLVDDRYFAGYPLIIEERLIGVLGVVSNHPFSQAASEILAWMANTIGVAIDRLWTKEALSSRREALLFRLANQIRKSLDLDTILATAVNEIRALLNVDFCQYLWFIDSPTQASLMVTHEAKARSSLQTRLTECPVERLEPLAHKVSQLEIIRVDDVVQDRSIDKETKTLFSDLGITSGLLLPLKTPHAQQQGAIFCTQTKGDRIWTDSEVELLQAVVDQLAIAIDQAEVYAQSRAAAFAAQTQAQQLEQAMRELKQAEARLVQTEKMSGLGQMVAGIAHEINNPINFISGNLNYTRDYIQDLLNLIKLYQELYPRPHHKIQEQAEEVDLDFLVEDLPKILNSMQVGAERIRQIVLSLRNFSRLDEAEMKFVNLHEGLDSTLMIFQNRLKPTISNPQGIQIVKQYESLPEVECYASQLNQVFMNVIGNAIDALETAESYPEPPTIFMKTTSLEDGKRIAVNITDNGPGMAEDILKRLFDPFFTTKPVGKGTGLGLSISYQIVQKHHGELRCRSQPGQGAEFAIEIPVEQH